MNRNNIEIARGQQAGNITHQRGGIEIRRQGKPVSGEIQETGIIYLVIDCSGSMVGDKLDRAKQGAMDFAKEARIKGYSVGVIQFGSSATCICEPQRELAVLERYVGQLDYAGSTNMAAGIRQARMVLGTGPKSRVIVIVTDGQPDSREEALDEAQRAKRNSIDIITIGTKDADRRLLRQLASRSDLSVAVSNNQLREGIASSAKMLPGG